MWLRLGVPFIARPHHCSYYRNQSVIDEHVDHILTCKQFNGSIKSRHDLVVREIKSLCHNAGLPWTDCQIGQLRIVNHVNGDTPDGYILSLPGRPFFIDVTIAHPTRALETYGGTSERFEKLLERLTSKAAEFNNIPHPILLNNNNNSYLSCIFNQKKLLR